MSVALWIPAFVCLVGVFMVALALDHGRRIWGLLIGGVVITIGGAISLVVPVWRAEVQSTSRAQAIESTLATAYQRPFALSLVDKETDPDPGVYEIVPGRMSVIATIGRSHRYVHRYYAIVHNGDVQRCKPWYRCLKRLRGLLEADAIAYGGERTRQLRGALAALFA